MHDSASNGDGVLGSETHPNNCCTTINACPFSIDTEADYLVYSVADLLLPVFKAKLGW
jgi:hypothetical protein